jgi:hypothetical protein
MPRRREIALVSADLLSAGSPPPDVLVERPVKTIGDLV